MQLVDYLPDVLKEIKEFKVVMSIEDVKMTALKKSIQEVEDNAFIDSADSRGIARIESMLGVIPKGTDTLDDRKFRILAKYNEQPPYTITTLEEQMNTLCGVDNYSVSVDYTNCILTCRVALTASKMFEEVKALWDRIVPLNMLIELSLLYNQHILLSNYTNLQLHTYTHKQLREDVI